MRLTRGKSCSCNCFTSQMKLLCIYRFARLYNMHNASLNTNRSFRYTFVIVRLNLLINSQRLLYYSSTVLHFSSLLSSLRHSFQFLFIICQRNYLSKKICCAKCPCPCIIARTCRYYMLWPTVYLMPHILSKLLYPREFWKFLIIILVFFLFILFWKFFVAAVHVMVYCDLGLNHNYLVLGHILFPSTFSQILNCTLNLCFLCFGTLIHPRPLHSFHVELLLSLALFMSDLFTPDNAKEEWQVQKEEFDAKKSICVALRKRSFEVQKSICTMLLNSHLVCGSPEFCFNHQSYY